LYFLCSREVFIKILSILYSCWTHDIFALIRLMCELPASHPLGTGQWCRGARAVVRWIHCSTERVVHVPFFLKKLYYFFLTITPQKKLLLINKTPLS
jgi:hypothetical protein